MNIGISVQFTPFFFTFFDLNRGTYEQQRWRPVTGGETTAAGMLLYCTVLYCTVLYCSLLYSTVLYCTVLYGIAWMDEWMDFLSHLADHTLLFLSDSITMNYNSIMLSCTVLCLLYFTAVYRTILYKTPLFYIIW